MRRVYHGFTIAVELTNANATGLQLQGALLCRVQPTCQCHPASWIRQQCTCSLRQFLVVAFRRYVAKLPEAYLREHGDGDVSSTAVQKLMRGQVGCKSQVVECHLLSGVELGAFGIRIQKRHKSSATALLAC